MQRRTTQTKRISLHLLKVRSFAVLSLMVVTLAATYIALVGLSVKNVVERKEAELLAADLRAQVAHMEKEYLTRVGDLTETRAHGVGLTKVASKQFVERRVLVGRAE